MNRRRLLLALPSLAVVLACAGIAPQPQPVPCTRCAGSGQVNSSYEAPLPARIDCGGHVEATGFLGLGEGIQHVNATVYNDGDQGGNFQISARAGLAGQSTDAAVVLDQASAYVAAHSQATHTFQFRPSAVQNMEIFCHVTSPMVVQQSTDICPVCSGSGQVMN